MRLAATLVIVVALPHADAADPNPVKYPFISFGNHFTQSPEKLSAQWEALSPEQRKTISDYLVGRLGLSDTGGIQLSGVYQQATNAHPKKVVFHFQQFDLLGSRLFWSVLIDPEEQSAQLLYHINGQFKTGKPVPIATPEPENAE